MEKSKREIIKEEMNKINEKIKSLGVAKTDDELQMQLNILKLLEEMEDIINEKD